jgi:hypothetical protein
MYYLRTRPAVDPIKFTLSAKHQKARMGLMEEVEMVQANYAANQLSLEDAANIKIDFSDIKTVTAAELKAEENFPQACSLDDPDCMACSA